MKNSLLSLFAIFFISLTYGQSCSLFFSEYLEGASNNKAIEVYNPLPTSVNLADYKIFRYNNGSVLATDSLQLVGTLNPGGVYVAGNPSAIAAITSVSDTLHTITFFNGDDAMELRYMPTNTTLDIIGIIGNDPGVNWTVGTGATSEFTLVRQSSHLNGELNWTIAQTEYTVYPQNTTTYLGAHTGTLCCLPTTSSLSATACESYTWTQNGQTYTNSGSYNDTLQNAAGCDSIITLNLTILSATTNTLNETACGSFTLNGQTYTASGVYTQNLTNAAGCDSTLTLNLTINSATTSTMNETACGSFTLNGQTYTASGVYTQNLTNVAGCDSTLTLNLTINAMPVMTVTDNGNLTLSASSADSYQWFNCTTGAVIPGETTATLTVSQNGSYAVIGTNAQGCVDTSNCIVIDYISVEENAFEVVNVFPNPTIDVVQISFESNTALILVNNALGEQLQQLDVTSGAVISLKDYEAGIYFITIKTPLGVTLKRIVKSN